MYSLVLTSLLLILTACGIEEKKKKPKKELLPDPPVPEMVRDVVRYDLHDQSCSSEEAVETVKSAEIFRHSTGIGLTSQHREIGNIFGLGVSSDIVKSTSFGGKATYMVDCGEKDIASCQQQAKRRPGPVIKGHGKLVHICEENTNFPKQSIESVSLTVVHNLTSFHEFYKKVPGDHQDLLKVELELFPEEEVQYTLHDHEQMRVESWYKADNARWIYPNVIRILPQSEWAAGGKYDVFSGVELWTLDMALAHEFSHHVMNGVGPRILSLAEENTLAADLVEFSFDGEGFELLPKKLRSVNFMTALLPFLEGHADMLAYYMLGGDDSSYDGVSCLEKTRQISSPLMIKGASKVLNKKALKEYFSTVQKDYADSCFVDNLQLPHIIGGMLARNMHKVFEASSEVWHSDHKMAAMAELSLDWLKKVNEKINKLQSNDPRTAFKNIVEYGIQVATKESRLNLNQCSIVKTSFSGFYSEWKDEGLVRAVGCEE